MQPLTRAALERERPVPRRPPRVLQVGEGNFIRAFVDWMIHRMNRRGVFDGSVVLTPARAQGREKIAGLQAQDGLFTVWLAGPDRGRIVDAPEIVESVQACADPFTDWEGFLALAEAADLDVVVSNTTEVGLAYEPVPYPADAAPPGYPARLAAYLYRRYRAFAGAPERGVVVLPCELVPENGRRLRTAVLAHAADWGLEDGFARWITDHTVFADTLVDRIVTGFPADAPARFAQLGYSDRFLTVAEPFHLWAVAAPEAVRERLPFDRAGLNVVFADDIAPYWTRKLYVLNGTHTFLAPLGLLAGHRTVRAAVEDPRLGPVVDRVVRALTIPYGFAAAEHQAVTAYWEEVAARFRNPFVDHALSAITANHFAKVRLRLGPVAEAFRARTGREPRVLAASLAAALALTRPGAPPGFDPAVREAVAPRWTETADRETAVGRILADFGLAWTADWVAAVAAALAAYDRGGWPALLAGAD
ncbi:MAG: tagaturonate reductase [Actinomycetia bacterium]|nr:tagaturonate reductase [Actinomycetes bacterium]